MPKVQYVGHSKYSFPDQKTGELVQGTKIYAVAQVSDVENLVGRECIVLKAPYTFDAAVLVLDEVYNAELSTRGRLLSLEKVKA